MAFVRRHDDMGSMGSMSMNSTMSDDDSMSGMMMGYLHGGLGDTLWFNGWTPLSAGATFGACVGLLFLAIFSRFLAAIRRSADNAWRHAALERLQAQNNRRSVPVGTGVSTPELEHKSSQGSGSEIAQLDDQQIAAPRQSNPAPPFVASFDIPRGAVQIVQSFIGYMLMLAVMTFNAWYFIAVLLGIGLGEMLFGRFGLHGADMGH